VDVKYLQSTVRSKNEELETTMLGEIQASLQSQHEEPAAPYGEVKDTDKLFIDDESFISINVAETPLFSMPK
jgi:hypothetical protein